MVRLIPNRLKSQNGKNGGEGASQTGSRSSSPLRSGFDGKNLVLKTTVLRARNLAAKDKHGTSDPYLVVTLGDAKESTPAISKTINPEWNVSFDLSLSGVQDLLLEAVCWDKDRFGKDYLGEFYIALEDIFADGKTVQEPKWYTLKSERRGTKKKKDTVVSGEVQMQFSIVDSSNPSAAPQDILQRFMSLAGSSPAEDADEDDELARLESLDTREDEDDDEKEDGTSDETDDPNKPEVAAKRRRKLRLMRLRKKTKARAYEFTGGTDVVGIVFLEIGKIMDLPPERNMTRTSFDMDPFVVVSLGRKTYRTRVIRHNLNPVYDEKMVFQVMRHEQQYSLSFSVVDRDKLSGNDFVGTVTIPLASITSIAPEADPETGLYRLREPPESTAVIPHKSRFRLPISRSSSSTSLNKLSRPPLDSKTSQPAVTGPAQLDLPSTSTSVPNDRPSLGSVPLLQRQDSGDESAQQNCQHPDDPDLKPFTLPIILKNKDRWEDKHTPQLFIKAKYLPYPALRQQFWRAMLKQYDADDTARVSKVELTTMLDTLGSTLKESTIDGFFKRFAQEKGSQDTGTMDLTFDQAVICLENQLQQGSSKKSWGETMKGYMANAHFLTVDNGEKPNNEADIPPMEGNSEVPLNSEGDRSAVPSISQDHIGAQGESGDLLDRDDLADERGEEHVIEIAECPLCHQPRLNKRSDADIITHIATCASQDWRQINNIVMAGFVTPSQAQRKWYSKVITKISYGGYKLGANSANILVQDRITGQINEERMSVYVRLGIRLMYKGLKSREMEKKRIKKLLRSLSIKQGKKYDDPASAREIPTFINFHKLDMSEVLKPVQEFKNFNEFFYRQLKPDARPCSAPDNPKIIVSPADCRSVVFDQIDEATKIWVKGREFSVERLLGKAYPEDAKRYANGAIGIFRLAPQDYHRFHVPVDGIMDKPKLIEGDYYTVNPMAIRSALDVYGENVRVVVPIDSVAHGRVMVICVGAMMVGSTVITRKPGDRVARAEELGYFKFGGSTLLVLFEPGKMKFDEDIVDNASQAVETLLRVGMSVGHHPQQAQHTPDMRKKDENVTQEERQDAKRRIEGSLAPEGVPSAATIK
ncbi:phosphatidylserine decarboxylase [Lasallia pustulata]|uniref:Phosphatidylserine decarboxylase proenzyme 2 n=1 Tax=Lasallia pustulata TaxID=136370 RepID=A0A1W5D106_9LECA|nr:phosphatidylserine decarboxylase [Lasallia pustulata]